MCGLTAVMGKPGEKMTHVFECLFVAQLARGLDSSGVAAVTLDNKAKMHKDIVWPHQLMEQEEYLRIVSDAIGNNRVLIGHARAATKGDVTVSNAHPFWHKHIILVHNGTLDWHMRHDQKRTDTDSESIAIYLAENGIEKTWKHLQGAAALVWYDLQDKSLNIISNGERPLHFAYSAGFEHVVIASEGEVLRHAMESEPLKIKKDDVYSATKNERYRFVWNDKHKRVDTRAQKLEDAPFVYTGINRMGFTNTELEDDSSTTTSHSGPDVTGRSHPITTTTAIGGTDNVHFLVAASILKDKGGKVPTYPNGPRRGFSPDQFNKLFEFCYICEANLKEEYFTGAIVDDSHCACSECTRTLGKMNVPLEAMKGVA